MAFGWIRKQARPRVARPRERNTFERPDAPAHAGSITGTSGSRHDPTELERAETLRREADARRLAVEQQLLQSQKLEAVGRLAGGIAHDFNNMLLVIMGGVGLLLEGKDEHHPQWKDLRAIEDAAERARGLTRQLLAVARKRVFPVVEIDLSDIVR